MIPTCRSARGAATRALKLLVLVGGAVVAMAAADGSAIAKGTQPTPKAGIYALDPPHAFALFSAQHKVVGRVHGRFDRLGGTVVIAPTAAACSLDVAIENASLSTQNTMRDDDLKGPDFFDAKQFPTVTYRGRGIRRSGDGWVMDGVLTIRGISKTVPLTFRYNGVAPAVPGKPARIAFHGQAAVQRAEFGMIRDLLDEILARSKRPDVWIEIDAEALASDGMSP
jgi:polyisoprenoid-binding protein YceI